MDVSFSTYDEDMDAALARLKRSGLKAQMDRLTKCATGSDLKAMPLFLQVPGLDIAAQSVVTIGELEQAEDITFRVVIDTPRRVIFLLSKPLRDADPGEEFCRGTMLWKSKKGIVGVHYYPACDYRHSPVAIEDDEGVVEVDQGLDSEPCMNVEDFAGTHSMREAIHFLLERAHDGNLHIDALMHDALY